MTSGMNNKYFVRASKVVILVVLGVVAVVLLTVNIEDLRQASSTGAAIIAPAQSSSGEYKAARAKGGVRYTGRYVNGTREEVDTPRILLNVQAVGKRVGTRIYPLLADEAREGPAGVQRNNARNLDVECLEGVSTNSSEQQGRWPAGCCSGGSLEVGVSSQVKMLLIDRGAPFFRGSRQLTLRSLTCTVFFVPSPLCLGMYAEYVVHPFLPNGAFLPCDNGLDF